MEGRPAVLSGEFFCRRGLCPRCYRAYYKRFPWIDPRDEDGHVEYIGHLPVGWPA